MTHTHDASSADSAPSSRVPPSTVLRRVPSTTARRNGFSAQASDYNPSDMSMKASDVFQDAAIGAPPLNPSQKPAEESSNGDESNTAIDEIEHIQLVNGFTSDKYDIKTTNDSKETTSSERIGKGNSQDQNKPLSDASNFAHGQWGQRLGYQQALESAEAGCGENERVNHASAGYLGAAPIHTGGSESVTTDTGAPDAPSALFAHDSQGSAPKAGVSPSEFEAADGLLLLDTVFMDQANAHHDDEESGGSGLAQQSRSVTPNVPAFFDPSASAGSDSEEEADPALASSETSLATYSPTAYGSQGSAAGVERSPNISKAAHTLTLFKTMDRYGEANQGPYLDGKGANRLGPAEEPYPIASTTMTSFAPSAVPSYNLQESMPAADWEEMSRAAFIVAGMKDDAATRQRLEHGNLGRSAGAKRRHELISDDEQGEEEEGEENPSKPRRSKRVRNLTSKGRNWRQDNLNKRRRVKKIL